MKSDSVEGICPKVFQFFLEPGQVARELVVSDACRALELPEPDLEGF